MRLPVHCCCKPAKRLGWVDVDDRSARPGVAIMLTVRTVESGPARDLSHQHRAILTQVAELDLEGFDPILAVKSADVPIEVWRLVPGFSEVE